MNNNRQSSIQQSSDSEFIVSGDLIFTTTANIYKQSLQLFKSNIDNKEKTIIVSLEKVKRADSSALALIVEWYRLSKINNKRLKITDLPKQLQDLAKLSSVDELIYR